MVILSHLWYWLHFRSPKFLQYQNYFLYKILHLGILKFFCSHDFFCSRSGCAKQFFFPLALCLTGILLLNSEVLKWYHSEHQKQNGTVLSYLQFRTMEWFTSYNYTFFACLPQGIPQRFSVADVKDAWYLFCF